MDRKPPKAKAEASTAKPRKSGKPKGKGKRSDAPKESIVFIPLTYNDGTEVPKEVIDAIDEQVFLAFAGWAIEGVVKGAYRMKDGRKRVEDLLKVSIVLMESQIPELEAMVARWAAELGQETMLLKTTDFVVKFVPPQTETEKP